MSEHKKPQEPELVAALKAHGLAHDKPSQLADSFRAGWRARTNPQFKAEPATKVKPKWKHPGDACDSCKHQCGDLEDRWCTNEKAEPFSNSLGSGARKCVHPTNVMYEKREKR
jgi:hypothetical protein